jgi:digeranylgeranylglycerophospholipid reductase
VEYDVVVVGSGPAGTMASKTAARTGLDTILIEEHAAIGVPVHCGEGLPEDGLKEVGLELDPRCIAARIKGATLFSPNGEEIPFQTGDMFGYVVDRRVFDKCLANDAARAGADIMVRTRAVGVIMENGFVRGVKVASEGKTLDIKASVVIAADGIKSTVARWAGLDTLTNLRDTNTCYQYEMVGVELDEPDRLGLYFKNEMAPGGYAWIFPKGNDVANVGIGVRGGSEKSPREYLDRFVKEQRCLHKAKIVEVRAGAIPVGGPIKKMVANGLMAVGTAAHMVNPMTGGGMSLAMLTGVMAGEIASQTVKEGETSAERLAQYEEKVETVCGRKLRANLRFRRAFDKMSDEDMTHFLRLFPEIYEVFHPLKKVSLREKVSYVVKNAPRLAKFFKVYLAP